MAKKAREEERKIKPHQNCDPDEMWKCRYCGGKFKSWMTAEMHIGLSPKCRKEHLNSGNSRVCSLKPIELLTAKDCGLEG